MSNALKNNRRDNFAEWYQEIVERAELADNSPVRGCMVIKPYGYTLWDNIKNILDKKIKQQGVQNAYFPLLIPVEFLEKEAQHAEGFAKETAVVTHHRLKLENGKLIPTAELERPYVIRPTSETIIGESFSRWIHSHKDLPFKINQWANIMRWEMRTRMFLRTSEFLWQEGHNVFATADEAEQDAKQMLYVYNELLTNYLAIYGLSGQKTEDEKFAGADKTYTIETIMQDGKALQSCTSHNLGQNFTKASEIKFTDIDMTEKYAYSTSWGLSTRIIGALIMSHSDDDGLILPPNIAPYKIVIIPVIHNEKDKSNILGYCNLIKNKIDNPDNVYIDLSNKSSADKKWNWIRKGAPIKCEIGAREVKENNIFFTVRSNINEKRKLPFDKFLIEYREILHDFQAELFNKNKRHLYDNIIDVNNIDEIEEVLKQKTCFVKLDKTFWNNEKLTKIMERLSLSYRCLPFEFENKMIIGKSY